MNGFITGATIRFVRQTTLLIAEGVMILMVNISNVSFCQNVDITNWNQIKEAKGSSIK
jgi:hypothetical protein